MRPLDYLLTGLSTFAVVGLLMFFINLYLPEQEYVTKEINPYQTYFANTGIQMIYLAKLLSWSSVLAIGIHWIRTKRMDSLRSRIYLTIIITIALLQWMELWYGSTFYYGEVRDKQGLGVPVLSIFLQLYVILRIGIKKNLLLAGIMAMIILLNYGIYSGVHINWGLSANLFIPGTSIPLW